MKKVSASLWSYHTASCHLAWTSLLRASTPTRSPTHLVQSARTPTAPFYLCDAHRGHRPPDEWEGRLIALWTRLPKDYACWRSIRIWSFHTWCWFRYLKTEFMLWDGPKSGADTSGCVHLNVKKHFVTVDSTVLMDFKRESLDMNIYWGGWYILKTTRLQHAKKRTTIYFVNYMSVNTRLCCLLLSLVLQFLSHRPQYLVFVIIRSLFD